MGYSWIDGYVSPTSSRPLTSLRLRPVHTAHAYAAPRIKDHAAAVVSDEAFEKRAERWPTDTPDTKEAYFIRETFDGPYPSPLLPRSPSAHR